MLMMMLMMMMMMVMMMMMMVMMNTVGMSCPERHNQATLRLGTTLAEKNLTNNLGTSSGQKRTFLTMWAILDNNDHFQNDFLLGFLMDIYFWLLASPISS